MKRALYSDNIQSFCLNTKEVIIGEILNQYDFDLRPTQKDAWHWQIEHSQNELIEFHGKIYFEFIIPRMGKRIDVLLLIENHIIVLEYKVGASEYFQSDIDQVMDYCLDLKNFHEGSHEAFIAPILIATNAKKSSSSKTITHDNILAQCCLTNGDNLNKLIQDIIENTSDNNITIRNYTEWENSKYKPTPTIIEATLALYNGHSVSEISRNDAGVQNIQNTSNAIKEIIKEARDENNKIIVFVTGVPGSGKTLVGLDIATTYIEKNDELYSVYLSGNGPLVSVLQEALAMDKFNKSKEVGNVIRKGSARSQVKAFIQNVHHFRDESLLDKKPPLEHVTIFDEAQRAWNLKQTIDFMQRKKGVSNFHQSEPEFLISCMNRHKDWAVIICLVGGGQEINTGEAGISEWLQSIIRSFPNWKTYISNQLQDSEYNTDLEVKLLQEHKILHVLPQLHLKSSVRSFRSEKVSELIKAVLDFDRTEALRLQIAVSNKYPIMLTRDINKAKDWLISKARGSERYGILVSSQAERLRPLAIHVKAPMNPVTWFLGSKENTKSSFYLEDVATEFHVQGLELDWSCIVWDADFRFTPENVWGNFSFRGKKWQRIRKLSRKQYQKNAYRVLLTRARQGMVIVVPQGNEKDPTISPEFYNGTYTYLKEIGFQIL